MLTTHWHKSRLIGCIVAGAMCLSMVTNTHAGDCGCELPCDAFPGLDSNCTCHSSHFFKRNCVDKALDAFAGGLEKVLCLCKCDCGFDRGFNRSFDHGFDRSFDRSFDRGFDRSFDHGFNRSFDRDRGCDAKLCDDGCDAALMDELMAPEPIYHHRQHTFSEPAPVNLAPLHDHRIGSPAPNQWQGSRPTINQNSEMRMTKPRIGDQRLGMGNVAEPDEGSPTPPSRVPVPEPQPIPLSDPDTDSTRESLFDSLSDPFRDDEARTRKYRSVRPSSYNETELRPIRRIPLSQDYTISSRSAKSAR